MGERPELRGLYELRDAIDAMTLSALAGDRTVERACTEIAHVVSSGGKILACGNGGSAADAQHFAAELVGRFVRAPARRPLPAIALSSDPSVVTCIANDFGYEEVFARQVDAHGTRVDALLCISTSGSSPNVLRAARAARLRGMLVVGLLGENPGQLGPLCTVSVCVPSRTTATIQEVHIALLHAFCEAIERAVDR